MSLAQVRSSSVRALVPSYREFGVGGRFHEPLKAKTSRMLPSGSSFPRGHCIPRWSQVFRLACLLSPTKNTRSFMGPSSVESSDWKTRDENRRPPAEPRRASKPGNRRGGVPRLHDGPSTGSFISDQTSIVQTNGDSVWQKGQEAVWLSLLWMPPHASSRCVLCRPLQRHCNFKMKASAASLQ